MAVSEASKVIPGPLKSRGQKWKDVSNIFKMLKLVSSHEIAYVLIRLEKFQFVPQVS